MNIDKLIKKLGKDTVAELTALDKAGVEARVIQAEQAMAQAKAELEANPKYQELKDSLKALTAGKRELNSRQNAIIAYALQLLESL